MKKGEVNGINYEKMWVRDEITHPWQKRLVILKSKNGKAVAIVVEYEDDFLNGFVFDTTRFEMSKPIKTRPMTTVEKIEFLLSGFYFTVNGDLVNDFHTLNEVLHLDTVYDKQGNKYKFEIEED